MVKSKEELEKLESSLSGLEELINEYTYDDQVEAQIKEKLNDIWSGITKLEEIFK